MHFSVKTDPGVVASSFKKGDKVFIDPNKLLPIERFTNPKKSGGGGRVDTHVELADGWVRLYVGKMRPRRPAAVWGWWFTGG